MDFKCAPVDLITFSYTGKYQKLHSVYAFRNTVSQKNQKNTDTVSSETGETDSK